MWECIQMAADMLEVFIQHFPNYHFGLQGNNIVMEEEESPAVKLFALAYILGMQKGMSHVTSN